MSIDYSTAAIESSYLKVNFAAKAVLAYWRKQPFNPLPDKL